MACSAVLVVGKVLPWTFHLDEVLVASSSDIMYILLIPCMNSAKLAQRRKLLKCISTNIVLNFHANQNNKQEHTARQGECITSYTIIVCIST